MFPSVVLNCRVRALWRSRRVRLGGRTRGLHASVWAVPRSIALSGPFLFWFWVLIVKGSTLVCRLCQFWSFAAEKTTAKRPFVVSALAEKGGKKCTSARKPKNKILQGTFHGALKTCLRVKSGQTEHGKALIGGAGEPPCFPRRRPLRAHSSASVTRSAAAQHPCANTAPIAHAAR